MTDTDQTTPLERAEERARDLREQAAATAVALLGGLPRPEGVDPIDLTDVIDLANWLLTGRHPLERVDSSPAPMWPAATLRSSMADRLRIGPMGATPWHTTASGRPADRIDTDDLPEPVDATIYCGANSPHDELTCGLPDGHPRFAVPGGPPYVPAWDHATSDRDGMAWTGSMGASFTGQITLLRDLPLSPQDDPPDPARGAPATQHLPAVLVHDPDRGDGLFVALALFGGPRLYVAPVGTLPEFGPAWRRANPLGPMAYAHREAFREADAADRRMPF